MKRKLLRRQWFRRFAAWTDILDDGKAEKKRKKEKAKKKAKAKKRAAAAAAARPAVPRPHSLQGWWWWWWWCLVVLRAAQSFIDWAMPIPE
ncbi:hypothetical protein PG988_015947 [Apiospora saccharicola]